MHRGEGRLDSSGVGVPCEPGSYPRRPTLEAPEDTGRSAGVTVQWLLRGEVQDTGG